MPTHYIARRSSNFPATGKAGAAPIYVDSDDNIVKVVPAGTGTTDVQLIDASSTQTLTNKTITGAVGTVASEVVTTTNVITAAESGKVFILNSGTAFQSTLPAPALGLEYTFIIGATPPSGGNHTVVTGGDDIIYGSAEVAGAIVAASAEDSINFIDGGLPGDWVYVVSDGTNWYVRGSATTSAKLTFTAA